MAWDMSSNPPKLDGKGNDNVPLDEQFNGDIISTNM